MLNVLGFEPKRKISGQSENLTALPKGVADFIEYVWKYIYRQKSVINQTWRMHKLRVRIFGAAVTGRIAVVDLWQGGPVVPLEPDRHVLALNHVGNTSSMVSIGLWK